MHARRNTCKVRINNHARPRDPYRYRGTEMLDKDYFATGLYSQIEEHFGAGHATARIRLFDGAEFAVNKIVSVSDHYVILAVYPETVNDQERESRTKYADQTKEVRWDHVAIPYATIARVLVTMQDPNEPCQMGFHR